VYGVHISSFRYERVKYTRECFSTNNTHTHTQPLQPDARDYKTTTDECYRLTKYLKQTNRACVCVCVVETLTSCNLDRPTHRFNPGEERIVQEQHAQARQIKIAQEQHVTLLTQQ